MAITLLLQARGKMNAERLAAVTGVSVRTIYRDMDALSLAHVPVAMDYGPGGGYYLPDGYRIDPLIFTSDEAVALALGSRVAGGYMTADGQDGLYRALLKLEAALPDEYRDDVRTARERTLFDTAAWYERPIETPYLDVLRQAVWGGFKVDLHYPSSTTATWRLVDPLGLVCKAGYWYLVAYCFLRADFRTFRLSRILDLVVRDEKVDPRPGFDLHAYWDEARDRFEAISNPYALTLSVPRDALDRFADARVLSDDGATVVLRLTVESLKHAIGAVLSLGPDAEALDPPELRAAVVSAIQAMGARYESRVHVLQ